MCTFNSLPFYTFFLKYSIFKIALSDIFPTIYFFFLVFIRWPNLTNSPQAFSLGLSDGYI